MAANNVSMAHKKHACKHRRRGTRLLAWHPNKGHWQASCQWHPKSDAGPRIPTPDPEP
jgi:hypothetical protein